MTEIIQNVFYIMLIGLMGYYIYLLYRKNNVTNEKIKIIQEDLERQNNIIKEYREEIDALNDQLRSAIDTNDKKIKNNETAIKDIEKQEKEIKENGIKYTKEELEEMLKKIDIELKK